METASSADPEPAPQAVLASRRVGDDPVPALDRLERPLCLAFFRRDVPADARPARGRVQEVHRRAVFQGAVMRGEEHECVFGRLEGVVSCHAAGTDAPVQALCSAG